MPRSSTTISKTRFQGGLRCLRRLWLDSYHRERATPPDRASRVRLAGGHRVGELARERWPEGRLIDIAPARHARAVEATRELLRGENPPVLFEAAFEADGVRVRADVVVPRDDGLELYEVKASSRVKDEHITDVAVQLHAIEQQGFRVSRAYLMHLDPDHVWPGGAYDPDALFDAEDVTSLAREAKTRVTAALPGMREVLALDAEPAVAIGRRCRRPYPCPYIAHCWRDAPAHHVTQLPRADDALLERLAADGIDDIRRIPPDRYDLGELREIVRGSVETGEPHVRRRSLRRALARIAHPVTYLDFETFMPALPLYPGTHPHEIIPFQWSIHVEATPVDVDAAGTAGEDSLAHDEFLWLEADDPRPAFVESLVDALPPSGSIVVYSGYEGQRIADLAAKLPDKGTRLLEVFRERVVDLLPIVRESVYHPAFHGSYSLKRVVPALVPGSGYGHLEVADGADASAAYTELVSPRTRPERRAALAVSLRAYCRRDTLAEAELVAALRRLARPPADGPA